MLDVRLRRGEQRTCKRALISLTSRKEIIACSITKPDDARALRAGAMQQLTRATLAVYKSLQTLFLCRTSSYLSSMKREIQMIQRLSQADQR